MRRLKGMALLPLKKKNYFVPEQMESFSSSVLHWTGSSMDKQFGGQGKRGLELIP